jgi:hypothetical protein
VTPFAPAVPQPSQVVPSHLRFGATVPPAAPAPATVPAAPAVVIRPQPAANRYPPGFGPGSVQAALQARAFVRSGIPAVRRRRGRRSRSRDRARSARRAQIRCFERRGVAWEQITGPDGRQVVRAKNVG